MHSGFWAFLACFVVILYCLYCIVFVLLSCWFCNLHTGVFPLYSLPISVLPRRFNPILTGGGGGSIWPPPPVKIGYWPPPPPVRNLWLPCDRCRSRHAFSWVFSFKSYASFDTKFAKIGPSVARSHVWRFVLARRHKICPKLEITDFLKMH